MRILDSAAPNTRFFYIAPTYRQAKVIAWDALQDLLPPELIKKKNEQELSVRLWNNALIELKGGDDPDSLRGVGLDGVVLDEWGVQNPRLYSEIVRPALTDRQGWSLFIGTPAGKNHFFDLFFSLPEDSRVIYKASETNIIAPDELVQAKSEMSTDEYNQEFECGWLYFSGQVYKEFSRDKHILKNPPKIDENWYRGCAIDYGQVNPTAVLWYAVDFDGRVYIYDEYYEAGKTIKTNAEKIREMSVGLHTLPLLDGSAFAKSRMKGDTPYSIADEYSDNGVPCLPAQNDPGSVKAGINRVKECFQNEKLFIFPNCENLIKELDNYRWKDRKRGNLELPEEPLKVDDHAVDALRYIILSRPLQPKWPKSPRMALQDRIDRLKRPSRAKAKDWYND